MHSKQKAIETKNLKIKKMLFVYITFAAIDISSAVFNEELADELCFAALGVFP